MSEDPLFEADDAATSLTAEEKQGLIWIHCSPNGNGRHARLAADLLLVSLGQSRFTWGRQSLVNPGETRRRYAAALQAVDDHDIQPLLGFVRT